MTSHSTLHPTTGFNKEDSAAVQRAAISRYAYKTRASSGWLLGEPSRQRFRKPTCNATSFYFCAMPRWAAGSCTISRKRRARYVAAYGLEAS
jgi:hypothetical protein